LQPKKPYFLSAFCPNSLLNGTGILNGEQGIISPEQGIFFRQQGNPCVLKAVKNLGLLLLSEFLVVTGAGLAHLWWCGSPACETKIRKETKATCRAKPF
jgi:hypothetical protein